MPESENDPIADLIAEYLDQLRKGNTPNLEAILARCPEDRREEVLRSISFLGRVGTADGPCIGPPPSKFGDFEIVGELGRGGMGVVYEAKQISLNRHVALKLIAPWNVRDERLLGRLQREAQAVAKLRHPNIVAVHATGEEEGIRYIAMELVPGRGLDELLREANEAGKRISIPQILRWIADIAGALQAAHEQGLIHRDVKPSNIRITPEGRAVLLDFGLAHDSLSSTMTRTGEFQGSPYYCSPEQVAAKRVGIDHRTDIYSLGVTLYEAVTGKLPFEGDTTEQVFNQILVKEPVHPRRVNPSISNDLETVILTAISKERESRYLTAHAFYEDLLALLEVRPIRARPVGVVTRFLRWTQRNQALALSLAAVFVLLAASSIVTGLLLTQTRTALKKAEEEGTRALSEAQRAEQAAEKSMRVRSFFQDTLFYALSHRGGKDVKATDIVRSGAKRIPKEFPDLPEIQAELSYSFGVCLRDFYDYPEAKTLLERSLTLREWVLGKEHEETLASKMMLASVYLSNFESQEAACLYRETFSSQFRTLSVSHPDTLESLSMIGRSLQSQGLELEALSYLEAAFDWGVSELGLDHYLTLRTAVYFASCLSTLGNAVKGEEILSSVFASAINVFGDRSLDYYYLVAMLGYSFYQQRRYLEAEPFLKESYEGIRFLLGADSIQALTAQIRCANLLWSFEKRNEAVSLAQDIFQVVQRTYGLSGEVGRKSLEMIQRMISVLPKLEDRVVISAEWIESQEKFYGTNSKQALTARFEHALSLEEAGRLDMAISHLRTCRSAHRLNEGWRDPDVGQVLMALGRCLLKLGEVGEATDTSYEALQWRQKNLSPQHWQIGSSQLLLGFGLGQQKKFEEAEPLILSGLKSLEQSKDTPKELLKNNLRQIAQFYEQWGKESEAKAFMKRHEEFSVR